MKAQRKQRRTVSGLNPEFRASALVYDVRMARVAARWAVGILMIIISTMFLPWTQNIRTKGMLTTFKPADRPQDVQSIIAGRIEEWFVQEGQSVKKGDTLVRLSEVKEKFLDSNMVERMSEQVDAKVGSRGSYSDKVRALGVQISALQASQGLSMQKAKNKLIQASYKVTSDSTDVIATMVDYETAIVQQKRADSLYAKGLISLTDLERRRLKVQETNAKRISAENKLLASRNEVINANIEISSIEAEYIDKISKAESDMNSALSYLYETEGEIAKMNNELVNIMVRQGFYYVTAPQDGYIVKAQKQGVGENVKEGDVILTIMPISPDLAAELYVDPVDVPLLERGRKVRLQFDGWPALVFSGWPDYSFGTFGGVVAVIDPVATNGKYRILVVPDKEDAKWPAQLRVGSGVYGWAMLNDVPVWYEVWRQMNGFPPDYMGSAKAESLKKYEETMKDYEDK